MGHRRPSGPRRGDIMQEPRLDFVTCASPTGFHRMAYWEWGDPLNDRVLVCVHGLTRTGRDFDHLARRLAGQWRVVCPDVAGRGKSDWLSNPALYAVPQYVSDMATLIARVRPATLAWVGTSMGGLIGLGLAGAATMMRMARAMRPRPDGLQAQADDLRLHKLVLNDVGPRLNVEALQRIAGNVASHDSYPTFEAAVAAMRQISTTFGPHTDAQWDELARHIYVRQGGGWVRHFDPALAVPLGAQVAQAFEAGERILWQAYDSLDCPVLIVRGQDSDLLSASTAAEMLARNPRARLHEVPGVGHAPTLMTPEQIEPIARFLQE
ncbi:alpha/beta fold hydrolase [Bordetella bronchiseptica]|uniref:alpha/beta fold hydrolase n=1 Tax=Bordetella bronchiseptica TaxID=518 RepID=UPI0002901329|nr:alpha/beta hydrolase [Bordetella bronchiseptica]CCN18525.1 probable hydrolase [Bordetella bronchiseptica MO211]